MLTIAHDIRAQYTLAYTPTHQALDGTYRNVRLKVTGALRARTRPGYRATP
ncbi:MAG TPA: hypothetical protein VKC35_04715 [Vicinamibacterales bacterium]|nr:hypothetical protein [Vicinamibacterales bacterium]